jgi:hypothetical protein
MSYLPQKIVSLFFFMISITTQISAMNSHHSIAQLINNVSPKKYTYYVNNNSAAPQPMHEKYLYISNMPNNSKLKHACLKNTKEWFVTRSCDQIEDDFKKVAETGCIKSGLFSILKFENKIKEHEYAVHTILSIEPEKNRLAEIILLNAYAAQLEKVYHKHKKKSTV